MIDRKINRMRDKWERAERDPAHFYTTLLLYTCPSVNVPPSILTFFVIIINGPNLVTILYVCVCAWTGERSL